MAAQVFVNNTGENHRRIGLMRLRWTALGVLAIVTILTSSCGSSSVQPNPTPIITGLFPSTITAGSQSFTLFIAGNGFISGSAGTSTAYWNGSPRSASVNLNTNQMAVTVLASDVASPGTALVTVSNPLPGGGITLNAAPFQIYPTQMNTPLIANLNPTSASPKGATFTLTVNGSNFLSGNANVKPCDSSVMPPYSGSIVTWNGSPQCTTFVSSTQLTAQITSDEIVTPGCGSVSVFTYVGGGNVIYAPSVSFPVASTTAPAACSLTPASVVSGAADFTLTVNGGGFASSSTVKWNGSARTTTFVSASAVQAQIKAADVANAGTAAVTVANSGGSTTLPVNFAILPSPPATATITSVDPPNATAGGAAFTLTVTGTNFISGSIVTWNGGARSTSYKSATSISAQIQMTDIAAAGTAQIAVLNVASNGASSVSAQFPFTVNSAAGAAVKFPQVVSVSVAGGPADGPSEAPAISSGGRYVAFYSQAKNLIAPAASGNIFVRDTCVGATNCTPKTLAVDLAHDGGAPNGKASRQLAISGDGRFVAFISRATNLVAGNAVVSLGYWELYVRDLCVGANAPSGCTPQTEIISVGAEGEAANGPSTSPSLSADGRFIAFLSAATNLGAQAPALLPQAYVRDTCAGPTATKACAARTLAVPVDEEDLVAGAQAGRPEISADGRYVALEMWAAKSAAQNAASSSQIVLADTCMGIEPPVSCDASAERISFAPDDSILTGANIAPSLNNDARFVVFESQPASSSNGNNVSASKVFLRDTCLGETAPDGCSPSTTLIANDSAATSATKTQNFSPAISASGRYISFVSGAAPTSSATQVPVEGSLVVRDTCFGAVLPCTPHATAVSESAAALSATHAALASVGGNAKGSALVADRYSMAPLSADGRFAAFYAPDTIAAEPASGIGDVYLTVTPF
jgi:WD40-like Beta Propeller Repeat